MVDEPTNIQPGENQVLENKEQTKEAGQLAYLGQRIELERFSGPLPPPAILEHYNKIIPNGADRILKLVEQQQSHRHHLEKTVIEGDVKRADKGIIFGFIVALTISIGGMLLISIGSDLSGLALILCGIGTLASIFVYSTKKRTKELKEHKNNPSQKTKEQSD